MIENEIRKIVKLHECIRILEKKIRKIRSDHRPVDQTADYYTNSDINRVIGNLKLIHDAEKELQQMIADLENSYLTIADFLIRAGVSQGKEVRFMWEGVHYKCWLNEADDVEISWVNARAAD